MLGSDDSDVYTEIVLITNNYETKEERESKFYQGTISPLWMI